MTSAGPRGLLDECVPRRLLRHLADLNLSHVLDEGWAGERNGRLLRLMLDADFAILITVDRNLEYQQNVAAVGIGVIVLHARSNRTEDLAPLAPELRSILPTVRTGQIRHLGAQ